MAIVIVLAQSLISLSIAALAVYLPEKVTAEGMIGANLVLRPLASFAFILCCFHHVEDCRQEESLPGWSPFIFLGAGPFVAVLVMYGLSIKWFPGIFIVEGATAWAAFMYMLVASSHLTIRKPDPLPLPSPIRWTPPPAAIEPEPMPVFVPPPRARAPVPAKVIAPPEPGSSDPELERLKLEYEATIEEIKRDGAGRDPMLVKEQIAYLKQLYQQRVKEIQR